MIKRLFAALLSMLLAVNIFPYSVLAAGDSANEVNFIKLQAYNTNVSSVVKSNPEMNLYVASNIQPDFNRIFDGIFKAIIKIVPKQLADGTLQVSAKELEERKAILKKKIKFENDIRLFTLYSFMNYTGYGDSSSNSEFSDIRTRVMEDLRKMNLKLSDNKYYSKKEVQFSYYKNTLRDMGAAPNFNIIGHKGNTLNSLLDLPLSLKEFYFKADIESLYSKYAPYYNAELKKIEDKSLTAIVVANNFLKIDNEDIPNIDIEINLLEAYGKDASLAIIDKYKGNAVITLSPSKDEYIESVVHEYLHYIINPIVDNLQSDVNKLSYNSKDIPAYSQAKLYYNDWSVNVKESIVKALEYRILGENRKASVEKAMNDGFILTQYFDESFDEFKDYKGSLHEFVKLLLQDYYKNNK